MTDLSLQRIRATIIISTALEAVGLLAAWAIIFIALEVFA